ncbi:MAG: 50S ribosome-binding GTPase, partial [Acinetobacter sp.]
MNQSNLIQMFINATRQIDASEQHLTSHLQSLQDWHDTLEQQIESRLFQPEGLNLESQVMQQAIALNTQLQQLLIHCHRQLNALNPAQVLDSTFKEKVILLMFGKFNAGKSSLCNILADCFLHHQQQVQYFHLDAGHILYDSAPLQEGATETTSRLQGICLNETLILLDTPGLHSVTAENAALTQLFLESADGVLWLTSSSSPGQVQELEALRQELHRHKPLLPIITRSDYLDEDEINGEIVHVLCNKSMSQRQIQEKDVQQRAIQKLNEMQINPELLQPPVSISSQMLKQAAFNPDAIENAGFNRLFGTLLHLLEPTLAYKKRKPTEVVLHALQEYLLVPLLHPTTDQLHQLKQHIAQEHEQLTLKKEKIISNVWQKLIPTLPLLLEQHANAQDTHHVLEQLNAQSTQIFIHEINQQLQAYQLNLHLNFKIILPDDIGYELLYAPNTQEIIAIGHDQLYRKLSKLLLQMLDEISENIIKQCKNILYTLTENCLQL